MRLEGIDLLRGLAVLLVVIYHIFTVLDLYHNPIFPYIHSFGLLGVSLFFIISGYLIYRSFEYNISTEKLKFGLYKYISNRLFRILPAYYFNLMVVLLMASFVLEHNYLYTGSFFRQIIAHLSFSSYFIYKDTGFGINGVYWTLSIEMLWYIVAPFFVLYIKKNKYLILLFLLSFSYLLCLDLQYLDTFLNISNNNNLYTILKFYWSFQLPGQLIYFISGIFIYRYIDKIRVISSPKQGILAILILILFIYISRSFEIHKNFFLNNFLLVSTATILFILLYRSKIKYMSILEWFGKISYSLYLWHMPILYIMKHTNIFLHLSFSSALVVFIISLLLLSSFSYYFIEEGGFQLRKKFEEYMQSRKKFKKDIK